MRILESWRFPRRTLLALALFAGTATISSFAQVSDISGVSGTSTSIDLASHETADRPSNSSEFSSSISGPLPVNVPAAPERMSPGAAGRAVVAVPDAALNGPQWLRYGGLHEFNISAGVSRVSGPLWGYRQDVDYEVVHLRYSRVMKDGRHFTAYYSPEVTPYAKLDEPVLDGNQNEIGRKHTTGGGVSPVGFTIDFLPSHRVQPFWESNYGVLYFRDRVLSPEGSQFMHTVDFGVGLHVYRSRFVSSTIGFRYNHMSNADISLHNPGTDAEIWYIGFSRFHSPKSRRNQ